MSSLSNNKPPYGGDLARLDARLIYVTLDVKPGGGRSYTALPVFPCPGGC